MKRKQNTPKVWDKMKALLRSIQSQVITLKKKQTKKQKTQVNNPAFYLQKLEKKIIPKAKRRKEIITIKTEISETKNGKTIENSMN